MGLVTVTVVLPAAVAELTRSLDRLPDETLCMASMRFNFSRPFLSTACTGMFHETLFEDNYKALTRFQYMRPEEHAALEKIHLGQRPILLVAISRISGPGNAKMTQGEPGSR